MRGSGLPPACVRGTQVPLLSEVVVKFALEGCHVYLGKVSDCFGQTVEDFWSLASYGLFSCFLKVGWGSGEIENSACSSSAVGYICLLLDALVWILAQVRAKFLQDLPDVDCKVSCSSFLQRVQLELFASCFVVWAYTFDLFDKRFLNVFKCFDLFF